MPTAEQLRQECLEYFDAQGIKYEIYDEGNNVVRLGFSASAEKPGGGVETAIFADFDEDGDNSSTIHFTTARCAECPKENIPQMLVALNEANKKYRWSKFWLDITEKEGAWFVAATDAMIFPGTVGEECARAIFTLSSITEDVLVELRDLLKLDDDKEAELRAMYERLKELFGDE